MSTDFGSSLSLSRHDHDRDSASRAQVGHLDDVWNLDSTRVFLIRGSKTLGRVVVGERGDDQLRVAFFSPNDVRQLNIDVVERVYLGKANDEPTSEPTHFVALIVDAEQHVETENLTAFQLLTQGEQIPVTRSRTSVGAENTVPDSHNVQLEWADLRVWGHAMTDRETGLFTQALALANWHVSHRFSPTTGEPTESTSSGWVRTTPSNRQLFPRTDVAIIVLVTDDQDRILLGNNAMWEPNRYSLLAGFVDPGESLEAAVQREVREEAGLDVDRIEYMGSQPWPFPASLMVGFVARLGADVDAAILHPDGEEILSLRWFTRDQLSAALDDVVLPGRTSIARALIEHWFGASLDQNAVWLGNR